jgi:hypothetical protein
MLSGISSEFFFAFSAQPLEAPVATKSAIAVDAAIFSMGPPDV